MMKEQKLKENYNKEERLTNIGRLSSFLFDSNVLKFVSNVLKFVSPLVSINIKIKLFFKLWKIVVFTYQNYLLKISL